MSSRSSWPKPSPKDSEMGMEYASRDESVEAPLAQSRSGNDKQPESVHEDIMDVEDFGFEEISEAQTSMTDEDCENESQNFSVASNKDEVIDKQYGIDEFEAAANLEQGKYQYEQDPLKNEYTGQKVGDLNCLWKPDSPSNIGDFCSRMATWTSLNGKQISSGMTVSITQLIESVSFAIIAGIDPVIAVNSTLLMSLITSLIGGSPGMISGVSTSSAITIGSVVSNYGVEYIFYTVALAGTMQFVFGSLSLGMICRLIPHSVMAGFINAMAMVTFFAQFQSFKIEPAVIDSESARNLMDVGYSTAAFDDETPWASKSVIVVMFFEASIALLICYLLPKWTSKASSLSVAILTVAVFEWIIVRQIGFASPIISDYENITDSITRNFSTLVFIDTKYALPPISLDTFQKICVPAVSIFGTNLVESILTKTYLDKKNGNKGNTNRMILGQGFAQVVSSLFGGIGGGARINQSMVNYSCGGCTQLSQGVAFFSILLIMICAGPIVGSIPLGAIVGVMFYVSATLFEVNTFIVLASCFCPQSLRDRLNLNYKIQRSEAVIILIVLLLSIFVDPGIAAIIGMTISVFVYAWDSGERIMILREIDPEEDTVTYYISGHIFFATSQICLETFTEEIINEDPNDVILNLEGAEIFDWSGMLALRTLHDKLTSRGKVVAFSSLSVSSRRLMEKCSSMWEGINFLFIEEITEEEKTLSSTLASTIVSGKNKILAEV